MRLFIGLRLDPEVKDYLSHLQTVVKGASTKGNFSRYDLFHITLNFLGDVGEKQVGDLCDIMDVLTSKYKPFNIHIGQLGSFKRKDTHTVYTQVTKGLEPLKSLQHNLERLLFQKEFLHEIKSYHPHITLSRETVLSEVSILEMVSEYKEPIKIEKITLFESSRSKNGDLQYDVVYESKFE